MAEDLKQKVIAFKIEVLQNGSWAEVITMKLEEPADEDDPRLISDLDNLHDLIYKYDKVQYSIPGARVCIKGLNTDTAIFRTKFVYMSDLIKQRRRP